jgi:hypothetical protein
MLIKLSDYMKNTNILMTISLWLFFDLTLLNFYAFFGIFFIKAIIETIKIILKIVTILSKFLSIKRNKLLK